MRLPEYSPKVPNGADSGARALLFEPAILLGVAIASAFACARPDEPRIGPVLVGDTGSFLQFIDDLALDAGSPLADAARTAEAAIAACGEFQSWCDGGGECDLWQSLECRDAALPAELDERRDDAQWLYVAPWGRGSVVVRGTRAMDGSVLITGELSPPEEGHPVALLMPSESPPGTGALASDGTLVQLRVKTDGGIDLSRFVAEEGWSAALFRLRSRLFSSAVLTGVWELAIYEPGAGERFPPTALALEVRDPRVAKLAMDEFLSELRETWPLEERRIEVGDLEGVCLGNLHVMPGLEPCYVTKGSDLVIGWNPASLAKALAHEPGARLSGESNSAVFHLDRFAAADSLIAASYGASASALAYPWSSARLTGERSGDRYRLRLSLSGGQ